MSNNKNRKAHEEAFFTPQKFQERIDDVGREFVKMVKDGCDPEENDFASDKLQRFKMMLFVRTEYENIDGADLYLIECLIEMMIVIERNLLFEYAIKHYSNLQETQKTA
ncbi:MAG: hypothetical protein ACOYN4_10035 [Bacteroidales bacterium]